MQGRKGEAGYSLVALIASATIMLVLMAAAVPTWRYVMKDDREQELLFRGGQIADAIAAFQRNNGNALPTSLDVLVKGKFLRKAYKDPMAKDGKWRLIRQGEAIVPITVPGASPSPRPSPGPGTSTGFALGPILGVASTSTDKSLRIFNGRNRYNEWIFVVGQPRVVGRQLGPPLPPGVGPVTPGGPRPGLPQPQPSPRL
jgi:type II secretory pathway pseudopilin PulG